jgi:excisionase family DNA binding protein
MTVTDYPPVLTASAVAQRLGLSERSVRRMAAEDEIPAFKAGPRFWRFPADAVERYVAERSNGATPGNDSTAVGAAARVEDRRRRRRV